VQHGTAAQAAHSVSIILHSRKTDMSLLMILLTIFLPPVAVALKEGIGLQFLLNVLLTLIGWLPGVIHAFWVASRGSATAA
jgi:uncharacterized membrane protein YqaE (UPF0057 family)